MGKKLFLPVDVVRLNGNRNNMDQRHRTVMINPVDRDWAWTSRRKRRVEDSRHLGLRGLFGRDGFDRPESGFSAPMSTAIFTMLTLTRSTFAMDSLKKEYERTSIKSSYAAVTLTRIIPTGFKCWMNC